MVPCMLGGGGFVWGCVLVGRGGPLLTNDERSIQGRDIGVRDKGAQNLLARISPFEALVAIHLSKASYLSGQ